MKTNFILALFAITITVLIVNGCKKKELTADDKTLFSKSMLQGLTYYKNDSSYLPTTSASGHGAMYFRVKYNAIAYSALTDNGRLPIGGAFPDGSIVVKQLYDAPNGPVTLVAIIQKSIGNSSAGANWLWGEYYADGSLGISVSRKGDQCTGCHSTSGNRDYNRVFAFYP